MDDESLILCVQHRPAIYDKKDKLHHNRHYIQKQWESIANEMKSEVNAVKTRWGHICDYYLKKYRENRNVKSGQAAAGRKKWHLYDVLTFFIPVYNPRETCSNLSLVEDATETVQATDSLDTDSQASSPMTSRADSPSPQPPPVPYKRAPKRKVSSTTASVVDEEILKTLQKPENDDEMWARSLIPSLQKLRHLQKLEFRVEVQSLLIRYLRRQDEEEVRGSANPRPAQGACNLDYSTTQEHYEQWMT